MMACFNFESRTPRSHVTTVSVDASNWKLGDEIIAVNLVVTGKKWMRSVKVIQGQGQVKFKLTSNDLKFSESNTKIVSPKIEDTRGSRTASTLFLLGIVRTN